MLPVKFVASAAMLPTGELEGSGGWGGQHGRESRVGGGYRGSVPSEQSDRADEDSRRVCRGHGLSPEARNPAAAAKDRQWRGGGAAHPSAVWDRGPAGSDRALGGFGPALLEAAEANHSGAVAGFGAARSAGD